MCFIVSEASINIVYVCRKVLPNVQIFFLSGAFGGPFALLHLTRTSFNMLKLHFYQHGPSLCLKLHFEKLKHYWKGEKKKEYNMKDMLTDWMSHYKTISL